MMPAMPAKLYPAAAVGWPAVLLDPIGEIAELVNRAHLAAQWGEAAGYERLEAFGLDRVAAIKAALGVAWAEPWNDGDGGRLWQPVGGPGERHNVWVLPNSGKTRDCWDVVAFDPARPGIWRLLTGLSKILPDDQDWDMLPFHSRETGAPPETLRLFATPLAWLSGGMDGFCVLDWAALRTRDFYGVKRLICDGRDHAQGVIGEIARLWRAERPPGLRTA